MQAYRSCPHGPPKSYRHRVSKARYHPRPRSRPLRPFFLKSQHRRLTFLLQAQKTLNRLEVPAEDHLPTRHPNRGRPRNQSRPTISLHPLCTLYCVHRPLSIHINKRDAVHSDLHSPFSDRSKNSPVLCNIPTMLVNPPILTFLFGLSARLVLGAPADSHLPASGTTDVKHGIPAWPLHFDANEGHEAKAKRLETNAERMRR